MPSIHDWGDTEVLCEMGIIKYDVVVVDVVVSVRCFGDRKIVIRPWLMPCCLQELNSITESWIKAGSNRISSCENVFNNMSSPHHVNHAYKSRLDIGWNILFLLFFIFYHDSGRTEELKWDGHQPSSTELYGEGFVHFMLEYMIFFFSFSSCSVCEPFCCSLFLSYQSIIRIIPISRIRSTVNTIGFWLFIHFPRIWLALTFCDQIPFQLDQTRLDFGRTHSWQIPGSFIQPLKHCSLPRTTYHQMTIFHSE